MFVPCPTLTNPSLGSKQSLVPQKVVSQLTGKVPLSAQVVTLLTRLGDAQILTSTMHNVRLFTREDSPTSWLQIQMKTNLAGSSKAGDHLLW